MILTHKAIMVHMIKVGATASAVLSGAIVLDEKTGVSIGSAIAIVGGLVWLARKLQNIADQQEESKEWREKTYMPLHTKLEGRLAIIEDRADRVRLDLARLEVKMDNLPCLPSNKTECEVKTL